MVVEQPVSKSPKETIYKHEVWWLIARKSVSLVVGFSKIVRQRDL